MSRASGDESSSQIAPLVQTWSTLARVARLIYVKLSQMLDQSGSGDGADRAGWIAPAFLLNLDANPAGQARRQEAMRNWDWLARRYRHQSHDLHERIEPLQFYETAAMECPRESEPAAETNLELSLAQTAPPVLSSKQSSASIGVQLMLAVSENNNPQKVNLAIKKVDDPRLRVELPTPTGIELQVQKPATATIEVAWNEDEGRTDAPPPPGFLLEARLADHRVMHHLVPVNVVWKTMLPRLVLSPTKDEPTETPFDNFRLRTLPGRQAYYVFVKNPAPTRAR